MTSESGPDAITGVTRPAPLTELSALLGVRVLHVERWDDPATGRRAWRLLVPNAPGERGFWDESWSLRLRSEDFRNPSRLNARFRRPGDSRPLLTKQDARRALRLMHEAVELGTDTDHHDTRGEGE